MTIAGLPARQWASGIRLWLAMMLALYVAFWLQLDGASSAAISVGILFQQTRGAAASKAFWRMVGTVVGVAASILIAGCFNGAPVPFFTAVAVWIGACVALSSSLVGDRAYGAVLSGYTVAIVAVANVDTPSNVFLVGINRGAAIMVGILSVFVINDVFGTPDVFPGLRQKLSALRTDALGHAEGLISGRRPSPAETAELSGRIVALKPSIDALASEYPFGKARSASARRAVRAMLALLVDARLRDTDPGIGGDAIAVRSDRLAQAMHDLDGRRAGHGEPPLPAYRSRRNAAWSGLRVTVGILIATWACAMSGWPQTSVVILQVGAMLGLSATTPDPSAFGASLLMTIPCAVLVAALTQFIVLDGSDAFPMLMVAMAPPVIGGGLLAASGRPALVGSGTLIVIFTPVLLSLSNPQSYNPLAFLTLGFLAILASVVVYLILNVLFPVSAERRLRWIARSAQGDLRKASRNRIKGRRASDWLHRDADRLGQAAALVKRGAGNADALDGLVRLSDLTAATLRLTAELDASPSGGDGARKARRGVRDLDPGQLEQASRSLSATLPKAAAAAERAASLLRLGSWPPRDAGTARR